MGTLKKILLLISALSSLVGYCQTGTIFYIKGIVKVNDQTANLNQVIQRWQTIRTESKSMAIIDFSGDIKIKIKENSTLRIDQISSLGSLPTDLSLSAGQAIISILKKINPKEHFILKTPKAAMGVRGTTFFAAVKPEEEWMCVQEGIVEVTTNDSKNEVHAGKGVFIKDGLKDKPKAYAWTKKINWSVDQNKNLEDDLDLNNLYDPKDALYD